jgi:hypothetical protein
VFQNKLDTFIAKATISIVENNIFMFCIHPVKIVRLIVL